MADNNRTTMELHKDTVRWLKTLKIHPRQSYDEVLQKLKREVESKRR